MKILFRQSFSIRDRVLFLRQLALILQSGLPLLEALDLLRLRLNKRLRLICCHIQQLVRHGAPLAEAMSREERFFSALTVQLVSAGEISGQLSTVLNELADFYEQQQQFRSFILKSALYPFFLLAAALCVLCFFILYLLPILAGVYADMHIRPSGMLAKLLLLHNWLTGSPLLVLTMVLLLGLLIHLYGKKCVIWLLRQKCCGSMYSLAYEIRFCKLLALLLDSGLNITLAIRSIARALSSGGYAGQLLLLESRLQRGVDIATALQGVRGLLSDMTLNLVSVGAATGTLPKMLCEAARIRSECLRSRLDRFRELFTPLLLLLVTLIIAAVVSAVLGPLLEILSALPE